MRITAAIASLALLLTSACAFPRAEDGQIALRIGTPPTENFAATAGGVSCVSHAINGHPHIRFAVGEIRDFTGKFSNEAAAGGFQVTQGGTLMVISALGRLGPAAELVERFDTRVAEQESSLTRNQLIQDPSATNATGAVVRPLTAGQYLGSDYYIVGGITEVNYNIASGGAELRIWGIGGGRRFYAMNVAVDLRLVDSRTLRVVRTVTVQKQMVGVEVAADVFNFFGSQLVDLNMGTRRNEPVQLGVRATLEYATLQLVSAAYGTDFEPCRAAIDAGFAGQLPADVAQHLTPVASPRIRNNNAETTHANHSVQ